uniref:Uncharacterized protein n=1 Tax=viral metagenome TaxID=1070528 RepID=A0A6M3KHI3_9ZZZZ
MIKLSSQDKKWMAESDARVLMSANEILTSSTRYKAALKEVKNIKKDAEETAKRASKVAGKGKKKK